MYNVVYIITHIIMQMKRKQTAFVIQHDIINLSILWLFSSCAQHNRNKRKFRRHLLSSSENSYSIFRICVKIY